MVAPPIAAVSSGLSLPCLAVAEQPTEKAFVSESTLSQLGFPNEFAYELFNSSTFSSTFTSPGDSTETEDEISDDEDDFFAGLTRRLAQSTQRIPSPPSFVTDKAEVKPVNSPESTLSGVGSYSTSGNRSPNGPFSQAPSPPTSPFREEDSLNVISAAASEVAKIKMANFDSKPNSSRQNPNPNSLIALPRQNAAFCGYYNYWLLQPQSFHHHQSLMRFAAPNAVKQPSAGTGVFLPRKYPNPSDSRKKSGGGSDKFPTKVVHQQNPKIEELSGRCQPYSQACLSTKCSKIDYVAGGCLKEEKRLPQEWMY